MKEYFKFIFLFLFFNELNNVIMSEHLIPSRNDKSYLIVPEPRFVFSSFITLHNPMKIMKEMIEVKRRAYRKHFCEQECFVHQNAFPTPPPRERECVCPTCFVCNPTKRSVALIGTLTPQRALKSPIESDIPTYTTTVNNNNLSIAQQMPTYTRTVDNNNLSASPHISFNTTTVNNNKLPTAPLILTNASSVNNNNLLKDPQIPTNAAMINITNPSIYPRISNNITTVNTTDLSKAPEIPINATTVNNTKLSVAYLGIPTFAIAVNTTDMSIDLDIPTNITTTMIITNLSMITNSTTVNTTNLLTVPAISTNITTMNTNNLLIAPGTPTNVIVNITTLSIASELSSNSTTNASSNIEDKCKKVSYTFYCNVNNVCYTKPLGFGSIDNAEEKCTKFDKKLKFKLPEFKKIDHKVIEECFGIYKHLNLTQFWHMDSCFEINFDTKMATNLEKDSCNKTTKNLFCENDFL